MTRQYDDADRIAFTEKWNAENCSIAAKFLRITKSKIGVRENVRAMNYTAL